MHTWVDPHWAAVQWLRYLKELHFHSGQRCPGTSHPCWAGLSSLCHLTFLSFIVCDLGGWTTHMLEALTNIAHLHVPYTLGGVRSAGTLGVECLAPISFSTSLTALTIDGNVFQQSPSPVSLPVALKELYLLGAALHGCRRSLPSASFMVSSDPGPSLVHGVPVFKELTRLTKLDLQHCELNDTSAVQLQLPVSILELNLRGNHLSARGIVDVVHGLTHLWTLDISRMAKGQVWTRGRIAHPGDGFSFTLPATLRNLDASYLTQLQDVPNEWRDLTGLTALWLKHCDLRVQSVATLMRLTSLHTLDIVGSWECSYPEQTKCLRGLPFLSELSNQNCDLHWC